MGLFGTGKKNNKNNAPELRSLNEVFAENRKYMTARQMDAEKISRQFVKEGIRDNIRIGTVSCPSGRIVIGDPLSYMSAGKFSPELDIKIKSGEYPVDISIVRSESFGLRICTARLKITEKSAVKYELAHSTEDTAINKGPDGAWTGFPVEAGMAAFTDAEVCAEYVAFLDNWYNGDTEKNHYDDYFKGIFAESYEKYPEYQRDGGDFIEWTIPKTEHKTVFFASGFGDGLYQAFWGYDADNEICELIIPFVDALDIEEAEKAYDEMKKNLPDPDGCIVTRKLLERPSEVGYLYREEPVNGVPDSGWRLFAGDEDDEYTSNNDNITIAPLSYIGKNAVKIVPLLNAPAGSAFYRDENGEYKKEN